jgi:hypothetical protein
MRRDEEQARVALLGALDRPRSFCRPLGWEGRNVYIDTVAGQIWPLLWAWPELPR